MTAITIDELKKPLPLARDKMMLPEFGEDRYAWCHQLSALEKNQLEQSMMNAKWTGIDKVKAGQRKERTIIAGLRDDNGNTLFQLEHIPVMEAWPGSLRDRLFEKIEELSSSGKSVDAIEKNSD